MKGPPLAAVPSLSVVHSEAIALPLLPSQTSWRLAGVASHLRYVERPEKTLLAEKQEALGRPEASCAALIPIRKSAAWWELTQEERRHIFEDQSHHIAGSSLKYLPMIARQLYHCRDLGEPFDFLTWSNSRRNMAACSRNWSACCAALRNRAMSSVRWISAGG